ncbi:MAG: tetratricopeptide repeat protein [Bacteroidota bacterium]
MKNITLCSLIIGLLWSFPMNAQQTRLNGQISIFNSKYNTGKIQYVRNAYVSADFSTPTQTDVMGKFSLVFQGIQQNQKVNLKVEKDRLEVVNLDQLRVVVGQEEQVKIYMASSKYLADYRKELYEVGVTAAERNLNERLTALEKERVDLLRNEEKNLIRITALEEKMAEVRERYNNIEEKARKVAERYAKINLDEELDYLQIAFKAFQNGELDKALQILNQQNLPETADTLLRQRAAIEKMRKQLDSLEQINNSNIRGIKSPLQFKADLHELSFQIDSAEYCYGILLQLDSSDTEILTNYSEFLINQNRLQEAVYYAQKCVDVTENQNRKAGYLGRKAMLLELQRKYIAAEKDLNKAIELLEQDSISQSEKEILYQLYLYRGRVNGRRDIILEEQKDYEQALKIVQSLIEIDENRYKKDLAYTYEAISYSKVAIAGSDEYDYLQKAIETYSPLVVQDSLSYWNKVLELKSRLYIYMAMERGQDVPDEMWKEEVLEEQLNLFSASSTQQLKRSQTLFNLANYYYMARDFDEAEDAFRKALDITRNLASKNPERFEPDLATTLWGFGRFAFQTGGKRADFKALYLEAYKLADKYPQIPEMQDLKSEILLFIKEDDAYPKLLKWEEQVAEYNKKLYWLTRKLPQDRDISDYQEQKKVYLKILDLWQRALKASPQLPPIRKKIANANRDLAEVSLYTREFEEAEQFARVGMALNQREYYASVYLVLALLYQDRFEEAEPIIMDYKDQPYIIDPNEENVGWNPGWLITLQGPLIRMLRLNILHKDVPKLRQFYSEYAWMDIQFNIPPTPEEIAIRKKAEATKKEIEAVETEIGKCWVMEDEKCVIEENKKLLSLIERRDGGKDKDYIETLKNFTFSLLITFEQFEKETPYVEELITLVEEEYGKDADEYRELIKMLVLIYTQYNQTEKAEALYEKLELKELSEVTSIEEAKEQAEFCIARNDFVCYIKKYQKLIELRERSPDLDKLAYREDLSTLTMTMMMQEQEKQALPYVIKLLNETKTESPAESQGLLTLFSNIYASPGFEEENRLLNEWLNAQ